MTTSNYFYNKYNNGASIHPFSLVLARTMKRAVLKMNNNITEKSVKLFVQLKAFGCKFFQVLIVGAVEEGSLHFFSKQLSLSINFNLQLTARTQPSQLSSVTSDSY